MSLTVYCLNILGCFLFSLGFILIFTLDLYDAYKVKKEIDNFKPKERKINKSKPRPQPKTPPRGAAHRL